VKIEIAVGYSVDTDKLSEHEKDVVDFIVRGITLEQFIEKTKSFSQEAREYFQNALELEAREDHPKLYTILLKRLLIGEARRYRDVTAARQLLPKGAEFLLLLVPRGYRENLVGCLEEEFATVVLPRYGRQMARWWYCWQVAASLAPIVWAQVKRIAGLILIWKAVK
jgi:hypothetical protein